MSNKSQNQYYPDVVSAPGETLQEIIEERGMSQADLAKRTGRPKKTINEIIKGKAAITAETAIQFERVLGTPASFWNNREQTYRDWLAREEERKALTPYIPWMKSFPIQYMVKFEWIPARTNPLFQLEELLRFFSVASPLQIQDMLTGTQWRKSPAFTADPAAVLVWLRQCEILAGKIQAAPYNEQAFRKALIQIRQFTILPPEEFIGLVIKACATSGVAVVFLPEIPGTRACGATRWVSADKPVIMLSLRYKTDDHLWFAFFHEAAHILLHGKKDIFIEDEGVITEELKKKEEEANKFASDFLIPSDQYLRFGKIGSHYSHEDIIEFANRVGVTPGIVVGRLQHDGIIAQQNFNKLKKNINWELSR